MTCRVTCGAPATERAEEYHPQRDDKQLSWWSWCNLSCCTEDGDKVHDRTRSSSGTTLSHAAAAACECDTLEAWNPLQELRREAAATAASSHERVSDEAGDERTISELLYQVLPEPDVLACHS